VIVFRGLSINKNIKKIYLADNQFDESDEVLDAIRNCFIKNKSLGRYDIRYNNIMDKGI
jgi:hypothetical protein